MNPDDAVQAASDAIDAWCAANRARWPGLPGGTWPPEFTGVPQFTAPSGPITVTYTTVRDEARAMIDASEDLQRSITELARITNASEDDVRPTIEAIIAEHVIKDGRHGRAPS